MSVTAVRKRTSKKATKRKMEERRYEKIATDKLMFNHQSKIVSNSEMDALCEMLDLTSVTKTFLPIAAASIATGSQQVTRATEFLSRANPRLDEAIETIDQLISVLSASLVNQSRLAAYAKRNMIAHEKLPLRDMLRYFTDRDPIIGTTMRAFIGGYGRMCEIDQPEAYSTTDDSSNDDTDPCSGALYGEGDNPTAVPMMLTSSEQQPPAASLKQQPPAASSEQQPPAASLKQQPPAASLKQQSPAASSEMQPLAASLKQQSPAASSEQQPPAASSEQQPPAASLKQQPPAASLKQQSPATSSEMQSPAASSEMQPLAASSEMQPPATSSPPVTPSSDERFGPIKLERYDEQSPHQIRLPGMDWSSSSPAATQFLPYKPLSVPSSSLPMSQMLNPARRGSAHRTEEDHVAPPQPSATYSSSDRRKTPRNLTFSRAPAPSAGLKRKKTPMPDHFRFGIIRYWKSAATDIQHRIEKCFLEMERISPYHSTIDISLSKWSAFFWVPEKQDRPALVNWPPMIQDIARRLPKPTVFSLESLQEPKFAKFRNLYMKIKAPMMLAAAWERTHAIYPDTEKHPQMAEYVSARRSRLSQLRKLWCEYSKAIKDLVASGDLSVYTIADPALPLPAKNQNPWPVMGSLDLSKALSVIDRELGRVWFLTNLSEHPFHKFVLDKESKHLTVDEGRENKVAAKLEAEEVTEVEDWEDEDEEAVRSLKRVRLQKVTEHNGLDERLGSEGVTTRAGRSRKK